MRFFNFRRPALTVGIVGIGLCWGVLFLARPLIRTLSGGALSPVGSGSGGLPPIIIAGVVGAVAMMGGSYWLQERVRRQAKQPPRLTGLAALAQALGLRVEDDPETGKPMLVGNRDGVWLRIRTKGGFHLSARHGLPLPPGLSITHDSTPSPMRFGRPPLDRILRVHGDAAASIDWKPAEAALLAALAPYPGAAVRSRHVEVPAPQLKPSELAGLIDAVLALIAALRITLA